MAPVAQPRPGGGEDRHRAPPQSCGPSPATPTRRLSSRLRCRWRIRILLDGRLVVRTRERYAAVQQLREQGRSITVISSELGLDRRTARRFAHAEHVEDLLVKAQSRTEPARRVQRPTCTSDSTPDTPTRRGVDRTDQGPGLAGAATRPCAATCTRSEPRSRRRHPHPFRPASDRSPVG